jgi:hypothetical protein
VGRLSKFFRNPFSQLVEGSSREDQLAAYVIREHGLGRSIEEILDDPYLKNRATPDQLRRLLERPDVIHAVGDHVAQDAKREL